MLQRVCAELWRLRGYDHFSEAQIARAGRTDLHRALRLLELALAGVATRLDDVAGTSTAPRASPAATGSVTANGNRAGQHEGAGTTADQKASIPTNPATAQQVRLALALAGQYASEALTQGLKPKSVTATAAATSAPRAASAAAGGRTGRSPARSGTKGASSSNTRGASPRRGVSPGRRLSPGRGGLRGRSPGRAAKVTAAASAATGAQLPALSMTHALAAKVAALVALQSEADEAAQVATPPTPRKAGANANANGNTPLRLSAAAIASRLQTAVAEAAQTGSLPPTAASGLAVACALLATVADDYGRNNSSSNSSGNTSNRLDDDARYGQGTMTGASDAARVAAELSKLSLHDAAASAPTIAAANPTNASAAFPRVLREDTAALMMLDGQRWSRPPLRLVRPPPETRATALSAHGSIVAVGGEDGTVTLWEWGRAFRLAGTFTAHTDVVLSLAWAPEPADTTDTHRSYASSDPLGGVLLCTGSADRNIALWRIRVAQLEAHRVPEAAPPVNAGERAAPGVTLTLRLRSHEGWVRCLAVGAWEGSVEDVTAAVAKRRRSSAFGHSITGAKTAASVAVNSPAHSAVDSVVEDEEPEDKASHPAAPSNDGEASGAAVDKTTAAPTTTDPDSSAVNKPLRTLLVSGAGDRTVQLHDLTAGLTLHAVRAHEHWVAAVAWQPCGRVLAASADCSISVLAVIENGTRLRLLYMLKEAHGSWLRAMVLAPGWGGDMLYTGGADGRLRAWRLPPNAPPEAAHTWVAHGGGTDGGPVQRVVALAARGGCLASASDTGEVALWDTRRADGGATLLRSGRNRWSARGREAVAALQFHRGRLLLAQEDAHVW